MKRAGSSPKSQPLGVEGEMGVIDNQWSQLASGKRHRTDTGGQVQRDSQAEDSLCLNSSLGICLFLRSCTSFAWQGGAGVAAKCTGGCREMQSTADLLLIMSH